MKEGRFCGKGKSGNAMSSLGRLYCKLKSISQWQQFLARGSNLRKHQFFPCKQNNVKQEVVGSTSHKKNVACSTYTNLHKSFIHAGMNGQTIVISAHSVSVDPRASNFIALLKCHWPEVLGSFLKMTQCCQACCAGSNHRYSNRKSPVATTESHGSSPKERLVIICIATLINPWHAWCFSKRETVVHHPRQRSLLQSTFHQKLSNIASPTATWNISSILLAIIHLYTYQVQKNSNNNYSNLYSGDSISTISTILH